MDGEERLVIDIGYSVMERVRSVLEQAGLTVDEFLHGILQQVAETGRLTIDLSVPNATTSSAIAEAERDGSVESESTADLLRSLKGG